MSARRDPDKPSRSTHSVQSDLLPDPYCLLNESEEVVQINQAGSELLASERADIEANPLTDVLDADSRVRFQTYYPKVIAGERLPNLTLTLASTTGDSVVVSCSMNPEYDDRDRFVGAHCIFRDVTAEKRREAELTRFGSMLDQSRDGILIVDPDGFEIVDANDTACDRLGYAREEILSVYPWDIETTSDPAVWQKRLGRLRETTYEQHEGETRRRDGSTFPVETRLSLVSLEHEYVVVQIRDITERKEREEELKQKRKFVETTQENVSIGWWEVDLVEDRLYWSDEVYRIHDLPVGEAMKLEDGIGFFHPEARPTIRGATEALTTEGEPYDLELRIVTAADRVRWVRTVGDPQYDDDGEIVGSLGLFQDITERKEREEALRQFREAIERTAHAVYITDTDGRMEYVNPAFEEMTGFRADEAIGRTPRLFKPGEHDTDYHETFRETIEAGEQWKDEISDTSADGQKIVLDKTVAPIVDDEGVPQKYVAVAQDTTLRRQYEEKVEQARTELRQVLDLIPDPLYAKNRDDEVLFSNAANAELHGMTRDEMEGTREYDIESDVENIENFDRYRQCEIEVMETGEPITREEELTNPDGLQHTYQVVRIPFEAGGTDESAVLGYARDVTALKRYEQRLETQRDDLDLLNQVVRHDIRNDLQLIRAYAGMLAEADSLSEEHQRFVSEVLKAANDAVDLTTTARELSEAMLQDETETRPIALAQTVQQQVDRFRSETACTITTISDSLPAVDVVADELLGAIFRNLLNNAVQHNDEDVPEITVSATADDRQVVVKVADNGRGVSDAHKTEIFGRGNQGLESEGTGIGLYLVQTLVDRYGGDVWVEDNDPGGAVFCVELQIAE